jgi:hypothetical protein
VVSIPNVIAILVGGSLERLLMFSATVPSRMPDGLTKGAILLPVVAMYSRHDSGAVLTQVGRDEHRVLAFSSENKLENTILALFECQFSGEEMAHAILHRTLEPCSEELLIIQCLWHTTPP